MAQQLQQPQGLGRQGTGGQQTGGFRVGGQGIGGQQPGGQQPGGQQALGGVGGTQLPTMPGVEPTRQLPSELRTFLTDVSKSVDLLEWTKTVALQSGPSAAPVVQVADDAAEVGKLAKELVARDSVLAPQAAAFFAQAAQQALQTFGSQEGQVPGIQRTTWKLSETLDAAQRVQERYGGGQGFVGGQSGQRGQQYGGGQGFPSQQVPGQ